MLTKLSHFFPFDPVLLDPLFLEVEELGGLLDEVGFLLLPGVLVVPVGFFDPGFLPFVGFFGFGFGFFGVVTITAGNGICSLKKFHISPATETPVPKSDGQYIDPPLIV